MTDDWTEDIADIVFEIMTGRMADQMPTHDPKAEEIAKQVGPKAKAETVKRKLGDIRDILVERQATRTVHLVSETYYDEYRQGGPGTTEEALTCVCHFRSPAGLRISSGGPGDLILMADRLRNMKCGSGKVETNYDRARIDAATSSLSTENLLEIRESVKPVMELENMVRRELKRRGRPPQPLLESDNENNA